MKINFDCKYFDGYKPCWPNKKEGLVCQNCKYYSPIKHKILVIKVRAAGDVIRHSVILHGLRKKYPDSHITWLSAYPELVPKSHVDRVIKWSDANAYWLENEKFDMVYSLDKDRDTCTLCKKIHAKVKKGFTIDENGKIRPLDKDAEPKFITGIFDNIMKQNKKHYLEEICEICGWAYGGEPLLLPEHPKFKQFAEKGKKVVGLNTGAADSWKTRFWPEAYWVELASSLKLAGYTVILLGGEKEHEKNLRIARASGVLYFGTFSMLEFMGLVDRCDLVVTAPTFALHVAIGLGKKVVVFVNVFPTSEFYFFGKGVMLQPNLTCQACYKIEFDSNCPVRNCMELIKPEAVLKAVKNLLEKK